MAKNKTDDNGAEITILKLDQGRIDFCIIGTSPFIFNALHGGGGGGVARELLCPKPKKNAAERASTLKHVPIEEYRRSALLKPAYYDEATEDLLTWYDAEIERRTGAKAASPVAIDFVDESESVEA